MAFGLNNNLSALLVPQEKIDALVATATSPLDRESFSSVVLHQLPFELGPAKTFPPAQFTPELGLLVLQHGLSVRPVLR